MPDYSAWNYQHYSYIRRM